MKRTVHDPIRGGTAPREKVVVSIPPPFPDDPYVELFYRALEPYGIRLGPRGPYTPTWLLRNRRTVDAFHLHWLHLFYDERSGGRAVARFVLFLARIVAIKLAGFKLFWTVHNVAGHERRHPRLDAMAARLMARLADRILAHGRTGAATVREWLRRSDVVELPPFAHAGHYPDTVDRARARRARGFGDSELVLLAFGKIRLYKGIDRLIAQFRRRALPGDRLVVAGRPETAAIEQELTTLAAGDSRIALDLRFIPPEDVQHHFRAADLAVYPYRDILTSGAIGVALAFGIPVVAPRLGSIPDLVGSGAGVLYDGDFAWEAIEAARAADRASLVAAVCRRGRELSWDRVGEAAARTFLEAMA